MEVLTQVELMERFFKSVIWPLSTSPRLTFCFPLILTLAAWLLFPCIYSCCEYLRALQISKSTPCPVMPLVDLIIPSLTPSWSIPFIDVHSRKLTLSWYLFICLSVSSRPSSPWGHIHLHISACSPRKSPAPSRHSVQVCWGNEWRDKSIASLLI